MITYLLLRDLEIQAILYDCIQLVQAQHSRRELFNIVVQFQTQTTKNFTADELHMIFCI